MKKISFLLLLLTCNILFIFNLLAQEMTYSKLRDGNGISIGLSLKSYEVTSLNHKGEVMNEIVLSGIFIPNEAGMPNLPRISRFVAIPQGAEVRVSVTSMETETLQNINIAPALKIQAIPEEPVMDYVKDQQIYATNDFYPQNPVEISEVISLRGINAIMVGITPFQFNPVTQELIVIHTIELKIEYVGGSRAYDDSKYRSPWFDPILKNAFLNYDVLPEITYSGKSHRDGIGCEYLIVIPNREDFRPLAEQIKEFRTKQGIYTKIMSLNEMGVTTTAQLKTYFHSAYNTWDIPPVAVLLMGDHNTNMAVGIPAETIYHPYNGSCITDNQYADVTGDLLPEMVFGRMAAENEVQMAVLVSKFLEYETQPCMEPSYYQNPITALGWQTERWFQICSEAAGGYWRQQGKTPVRINAIYSGTPGNSWSSNQNTSMVVNVFGPNGTGYLPATPSELGGWSGGTAAQVVTALNNGAFALQHRDHGFENGWGEPAFQTNHINQLTNVGKMTYLFTINCLTGKFNNNSPCFGEVFHRYTYQGQNAGCVGFLGPTEVSYSFVNDAFVWGMYDLFDPNFLPTYGYMGPHSAAYSGNWMPAFGNVAGKYFLQQSSWPYNTGDKAITHQMFTAHSDIFLRLFTEVPQAPEVNHEDIALTGVSDFYITANEGTLITLTAIIEDELEILDVAVATGEMQTMNIPATLMPTTEINVVVTGQNFLRYESVVEVIPAEGAYVISTGYSVGDENILTYISTNNEIIITLKNVGVEASGSLIVTMACDDPQLTINNATAQCGDIAPDGTATVSFKVTVDNSIPDNKTFLATIVVTGSDKTTESKLSLKAYAPVFALEKVLINGVENGNLEQGTKTTITAVFTNSGGADAYRIDGDIEINSEYLVVACPALIYLSPDLPAGESMEITFTLIADAAMPVGHEANFNLLLSAQYDRTFAAPFKATCIGSGAYCTPGTTSCSSNDKFTLVQLAKTTAPTNYLINNSFNGCTAGGYENFTNMVAVLEPGQQYTIRVNVSNGGQQIVRGWFDLNGNDTFDNNEQLIAMTVPNNGTNTQTFTIPAEAVPGTYRFRLRCQRTPTSPLACNNYTNGQTHDYSIVIPEIYPRVQNVNAVLEDNNITVTWNVPEEGTPVGYNIYRDKVLLNTSMLTVTNFKETDVAEDIYVYHVTAVYANNKESFAQMSNVICNIAPPPCEMPLDPLGAPDGCVAVITWDVPKIVSGVTLLNYNIYRDEEKIAEVLPTEQEYRDAVPENGTYMYQVSAVYVHCEESEKTYEIEVVINCIGINEIQPDAFQLFPNPANHSVLIHGAGLNRVELYDLQGRKLAEYHNIKDKMQINDLNRFENGVYFVRMYSENHQVATKRLVIMR